MKTKLAEIRESQMYAKYLATVVYEAVAGIQPGLLSEQQLKQLYPVVCDALYTANHAVTNLHKKTAHAFHDATFEKVKRGVKAPHLLKSYAEKLEENGEVA